MSLTLVVPRACTKSLYSHVLCTYGTVRLLLFILILTLAPRVPTVLLALFTCTFAQLLFHPKSGCTNKSHALHQLTAFTRATGAHMTKMDIAVCLSARFAQRNDRYSVVTRGELVPVSEDMVQQAIRDRKSDFPGEWSDLCLSKAPISSLYHVAY